ncbi:MAG: rhomboid family intramembrane serine protease, partial [Thaumarchaeota archaeon]|nr:rhomboid family intramembrane serine protease [Nitrososphaerota archaeon]
MFPLYDLNRPVRRAYVNWALIGINVIAFLLEVAYTNNFTSDATYDLFIQLGVVPYYIFYALNGTEVYRLGTLLTSIFLHAGFWHIAGNMVYLFVFGDNVEDKLGHTKYLGFYLFAGAVGGLTQVFISLGNGVPDVYIPGVGASGAISGVLAAYVVFFPKAQVLSLLGYFIIPIRALWFIGFWFVLQLLLSSGGADTGVAYGAHIGGFVFGLVLALLVRPFIPRPDESS